jgi:hypothetical protein
VNSDEEVKEQERTDQRETQISYDELLAKMKSIVAENLTFENEVSNLRAEVESSK